MRARLLRIAGRLVLLLVALAVVLCSCEAAFRVLGWRPWAGDRFDPVFGRQHIPNYVGVHNKERWVVSRTNSQGLRDREYSVEKPPGVFRIAMLGDSYVEALQVPLEKSVHKVLEARLNAASGGGSRFEVISFGVSGNSTAQELLNYRYDAARYKPDLVLVGFTWHNDVVDNSKEMQPLYPGGWLERPFFEVRDGKLVLDDSFIELHRRTEAERNAQRSWANKFWMRWIKPHSYFLDFLNQQFRFAEWKLEQKREAVTGGPPFDEIYNIFNPQMPPHWQRAWALTEQLFVQLRDECAANGSRLAVMEVTFGMQLYPEYRERALYNLWSQTHGFDFERPGRLVAEMMQRLGVPYLPLTPQFREDFARTHRYLHGTAANPNAHWTAEGHALAARDLERFLFERGLAPASGAARH